jgi:hypothetical protein
MIRWFTSLFGPTRTVDDVKAANLYEALVLEGGPGSDTDDFLSAVTLGVNPISWPKFGEKRLFLLESLYYLAYWSSFAKTDASIGDKPPFVELPKAMERKLQAEWGRRGVRYDDPSDVGARCFEHVEMFCEEPIKWSRRWLAEFYDDEVTREKFVVEWATQCQRQFKTMVMLFDRYS